MLVTHVGDEICRRQLWADEADDVIVLANQESRREHHFENPPYSQRPK